MGPNEEEEEDIGGMRTTGEVDLMISGELKAAGRHGETT